VLLKRSKQMSYLLRNVRVKRWSFKSRREYFPADPLADLNTTQNNLSCFYIDDKKSNLEDIIAGLASNKQRLSHFGYILIDLQVIKNNRFKINKTEIGTTPCLKANARHVNIEELTAKKLINFAKLAHTSPDINTKTKKQVKQLLLKAAKCGNLDTSKMWESLKKELGFAQNPTSR